MCVRDEDLRQIKDVNIIEYIEKNYPNIELDYEGNDAICKCMFHNDESPSLRIYNENNNFKCFACGATGSSIIDIVMKLENLTQSEFKNACQLIADNANIDIKIIPPNPYHEKYKDDMVKHMFRYIKNLQNNPEALSYLKVNRGFTDETIKAWGLGLTDEFEHKIRNNPNEVKYINNRITIPVPEMKIDAKKVIAFGYRTLEKDSQVKYKNDRNQNGQDPNLTGVFIKGHTLFGYKKAYEAIKSSGYVIICEGFFDVISLHQAGIKASLGIMGKEITKEQIEKLKRLTNNVILFLDGDEAGINGMKTKLPLLLQAGLTVNIIVANNDMDPADICKKYNFDTEKVANYINKNSKSAIKYFMDEHINKYEEIILKEKKKVLEAMTPLIGSISNEATRLIYKDLLLKKINLK
jgi:DNA primase